MTRATASLLLSVALCATSPVIAHAQPETSASASSSRAAQKAFDEGMALMEAKRYAEACVRLEESQRIEAGMGTQFRLAQCYEQTGRIASAWQAYDAVATEARAARLRTEDPAAKQDLEKRESYSQGRADALVAKVARAAIRVPADVALLPGLAVSVDGVIVPPATWGGVPVDVGMHRVVVQATGKQSFNVEMTIAENGERMTVQVPPLQEAPDVASNEPKPDIVVVTRPSDGAVHPVAIAGVIVGVVGLAGLGAGIGLGFAAKSKHDDSQPHCNGNVCQPDGLAIREDALALGDIGTGIFIGGCVVAATGIGMLIAGLSMGGGEAVQAHLSVTPTGGSLMLRW